MPSCAFRGYPFLCHQALLYGEFDRAEVDQQTSFDPGRFQISQQLSNVFIGGRLDRLEFHDQAIFDEQVGEILTQDRAVFVVDGEWKLVLDFQTLLPQAIRERVLVNLQRNCRPRSWRRCQSRNVCADYPLKIVCVDCRRRRFFGDIRPRSWQVV